MKFVEKGMKALIAIDARKCERKGSCSAGFVAPFGLAIIIDSKKKEAFRKAYEGALRETLLGFGKESEKCVYKSYDLFKLLGMEKGISALEEFSSKISTHVFAINVFFSTFSSKKLPMLDTTNETIVYAYRENESGVRHLSLRKFLHKLIEAYPYVCGWKVLQENEFEGCELLLDSFDGEITEAWRDIEDCKEVNILTYGDNCSELIATADILLKLLEIRMQKGHKTVNSNSVSNCLSEYKGKLRVKYIGHDVLNKITPVRGDNINVMRKIKHPVIFVLPPDEPTVGAREMMLKTPVMPRIFDLAYGLSGCVKFFDPKKDADAIKEGDFLICPEEKKEPWKKSFKQFGIKGVGVVALEELIKSKVNSLV
jgi:hypothetical protein